MIFAAESDPSKPVLVLFRHDLRIADNGALAAAAESGKPVVCAFVFDQESQGVRPIGAARRWWLHHSLKALQAALDKLGASLVLRRATTSSGKPERTPWCGTGVTYRSRPLSIPR